MPKLTKLKPPEQQAIEDELRKIYGGAMSTRQVGSELGLKDTAAKKWCDTAQVPYIQVERSARRYRVADIAAAIYQNTYV